MCLSSSAKERDHSHLGGSPASRVVVPVLQFDPSRGVLQRTHRLATADLSQVCDGRNWLLFRGVSANERKIDTATGDAPNGSNGARAPPSPQEENQEHRPQLTGASFAAPCEEVTTQARDTALARKKPPPDALTLRRRSATVILRHSEDNKNEFFGAQHSTATLRHSEDNKKTPGRRILSEGNLRRCVPRNRDNQPRVEMRRLSTPRHRDPNHRSMPGILQRSGSMLDMARDDSQWVAPGVAFSKNMEVYLFKT